MIIFPAVDLQNGKAVRLKQGKAEASTQYGNPLDYALKWQDEGAQFLHLIDLDGAFGQSSNGKIVEEICQKISIPVQLGGGIRTEEHVDYWLNKGVNRLIIGTMALQEPYIFQSLCEAFPGRIGLSLDAKKGQLKTHGWVYDSPLALEEVVKRVEKDGAAFIIYTDIERDGMQTGLNYSALKRLASLTKLPLIAAGGLASIGDVKTLYRLSLETSIIGAISGKALYEGELSLVEAMAWIKSQK